MSTAQLPSSATSGFAKGALYDQHRPSYPSEAVQQLLEAIRVDGVSGARIIDLAAGTGKFTEILAERAEEYEILAVEPLDTMREQLERKKLERVTIHNGHAKSIPAEDESIDAVVVAQAFHWFANQESLEEIFRVLKSDGVLGMIWNVEDYNQVRSYTHTTAWEARLNELLWGLEDNQPRFRHEKWKAVFDSQIKSNPLSITTSANPLFSLPLGENLVKWTVWLSKEGIWDRYRTLSQVAVLEGEQLETARIIFLDAMNGDDVETNEKGEIALHGVTVWAFTSKVPATTVAI